MLYFGYKFTDRIVFNSELEFEHASTEENVKGSEGEVGMEFALLDFNLIPEFNLHAGLLIPPFVIINVVHEPTTFYGVFWARTELFLIPTMWRENGLGIFGDVDLSRACTLSHKAHFMNSFDVKGFTASSNRGISFNGSEALFNNVALVSRAEYKPLPYITITGSIFLGDTGEDATVNNPTSQFNGQKVKGFFHMYEGDIQLQYRGFECMGLFVLTVLGDAARINALKG
ncbi:MAG: hypothetical protein ACHQ6U_11770, partial [Thermodesulfobacteriota bacterium]